MSMTHGSPLNTSVKPAQSHRTEPPLAMCSLGELALVPQPGTSVAASMECANWTTADAGAGASAEGNRPKESEFREQIVKLAGIACHEDEEKSRIELLEKLKGCNKIGLIELCRYFDIRGSTSTRKDDIVTILMEFLMEHGSRIDCAEPDKKLRKRKRNRDGADLSGGDPSKKRKPDGTVLETHGEEEAAGKKCVKDRANCSDFHLRGNRNVCTDNKTGQFSKGKAKPGQFEGVNGSMMEKLAVVPLPGLPIHTHEQILVTTPCAKFVSNVENNSMDMKASTKKTISVSKKKATHMTDRNEKFCDNNSSRGDVKPRKQAVRPTKDELRQAVFCILDTANFATMTFGEVVKAVAVISPMHFTHSTPGRGLHDAACFAPTLQIFTLRLAGIKGGLEWPLSVYGVPETKLITIVTFSSLAIEASLKNSIKMLPFSSPYRTGAEGERRADERWVEEWLGRRWSRGGAAAMQGSLGSKREDTREGTRGLRI